MERDGEQVNKFDIILARRIGRMGGRPGGR